MNLINTLKYITPFAVLSTYASLLNFETANQIIGHLGGNIELTIQMLRELSLTNPTLDDVSAKEVIITIVNITGMQFSTEIYEQYGITEEDLPSIIDASPRMSGISDSTLDTTTGDPSRILHGYGCWCRFGNNNAKGKGKAVDEIDTLCKQLHQSYECLRMDILAEDGAFCDPKTVEYDYDMVNYIMATNEVPAPTLRENCQAKNPNDRCASQTCELELGMLMDFAKGKNNMVGALPISVNADFTHKKYGGPFSVEDNCGFTGIAPGYLASGDPSGGFNAFGDPKPVPDPVDKECCGTFPKRFPFNTLGGDRQCCNGRTYNQAAGFQCCADSYVSMSCS